MLREDDLCPKAKAERDEWNIQSKLHCTVRGYSFQFVLLVVSVNVTAALYMVTLVIVPSIAIEINIVTPRRNFTTK